MKSIYQHSPKEVKDMSTSELRESFLITDLMTNNSIRFTYTHYDRVMVGGAKPVTDTVVLDNKEELRSDYFLERREMGIINIGGKGVIETAGNQYELDKLDCLYIGKGNPSVTFTSFDPANPAMFYILSAPAHATFPVQFLNGKDASPVSVGSLHTSNERTIYKYIHADGIKSCQLVMGLTVLSTGSVWNTMPAHTHTRRMEAYFYFDVPDSQRVFHLMGEPSETRHIVMSNNEAVVSPAWSIHSGCGTSNYSFIWGMAGENYTYTDMDMVPMDLMK
jgi:4-deoxy-L-threo-5-hexosulose-uronate ketol-isomerase